ncbi:MAG: histidine phosphatase family protein [Oculatellaceae cyanobacterium Prado106]|nr:histidine phosphatase family protein [Oculatellaceae cyanobacterium Prado106]
MRAITLIAIAGLSLCLSCAPPERSSTPSAAVTPVADEVSPSPSPSSTELWSQMQQGTGYVVLLRHAQTEPGTGDPPGFQLNDCSTQRNLSDEGRKQATQIGQAFRDRNIPVVQVLSSQYCRCLETARLLNLGEVTPLPALNSIFEDRSTATEQSEAVRQQILDHRNQSGVIVQVSHFANIGDISGVNPQPGGAVVMRANQQGALEVVGQIQNW